MSIEHTLLRQSNVLQLVKSTPRQAKTFLRQKLYSPSSLTFYLYQHLEKSSYILLHWNPFYADFLIAYGILS